VDLGLRVHRNRPLAELTAQAAAVLDVALTRAGVEPADGAGWPPLAGTGEAANSVSRLSALRRRSA